MDISIITVFLTIKVLLNLGELNAMEAKASSSGSKKRARPIPGGKFKVTPRGPAIKLLERAHDTTITHLGETINVWLNEYQQIVQAVYPNHTCPSGNDYNLRNFIVRLVILGDGKRFVECLDQEGNLLGVRASRTTRENCMEPNSTQWFIVYMRNYFRVRINPHNKQPISISLAAADESKPPEGEPNGDVTMAGFKFKLYTGPPPYRHITGAALPSRLAQPKVVTSFHDLMSRDKR